MQGVTRRQFIGYGGALAALTLAGCSSGGTKGGPSNSTSVGAASGPAASGDGNATGSLVYWDDRTNVATYEKQVFAQFAKTKGGMKVSYQVWDSSKMGQALQLAFKSNQMPDVFTPQGVNTPTAGLVSDGWFAPIDLDPAIKAQIPAGNLIEGVNVFDGKVYGVPLTAAGTTAAFFWFNKDLFKKAGLDPDNPPATYDDIRAAARKIKASGGTYGWILPTQNTGNLSNIVNDLASAAGSPSNRDGMNFKTGAYAYDDDYRANVFEWWLAMQKDGVLMPGSASINPKAAAVRWMTGSACYFFYAQFCPGVVLSTSGAESFISKVGFSPVPIPQSGGPDTISSGPVDKGVNLFISKSSKYQAQASKLISTFAGPDAQALMAEGMNAPPLYPDALSKAKNINPLFTTAVDWESKHIFLAPIPVVRNPDIEKVQAQMKAVTPDLGDIAAGVISGDITDYKSALKKLVAASEAARESAISAATKAGAKVSDSDWAFPDWQPGKNYETKSA